MTTPVNPGDIVSVPDPSTGGAGAPVIVSQVINAKWRNAFELVNKAFELGDDAVGIADPAPQMPVTVLDKSYLFVQAAGKVRRYVQRWSGTTGSFPTSAISTSSSSLDNMLHVNFSSGGLADIKKWVAGTGNLGLTFGGPVRNCPTLDNGAQGDVTLELIDDKIFAYVGGLLVAWGQDAQIATWGASLNVAVGQLHNANEKIYGMWTYDEQAERSDLGNTFPIAEGLRNGAPIQTGTLMVAPGGTTQLADFDVVARENRDQVFRSAFAVTQHYKAGTGYGVRQYFGNGGYDAASPGDTYAEWSTSMLGFRFVVGGGTRGTFPHPAFNYGDAVFPSITIGAEASTTPRIVSAANLAGLATVPDGSLGMTADGKFAQRVSGAWVEKGAAGFTNPMTTSGDIIYGTSGGTATRLGAGTDGQVLTLASGLPSWVTPSGGGGGLTDFTEALSTSSPNATNNVASLTVTGGSTNAFAALVPKGTGGILAQVPNGSTSGGNARGSRSVDLQMSRAIAAQVASGSSSFAAGNGNTASGDTSIAMGTGSVASGAYSIALGNTVSASQSYAASFGGNNNDATATGSLALGGQYNQADGNYGVTFGGSFLKLRSITGLVAFGNGGFTVSTSGRMQGELVHMGGTTNSATPRVVSTDGSATASTSNQLTLENNSVLAFTGVVSAKATTGDAAAWEIKGVAKRGASAASTAIVGSATVTSLGADAGASAWTISVTADTTNGAIAVTVTGVASTNISWGASLLGNYGRTS